MYLALQEQYPLIDIIRATQKVEKIFKEKFDAGKGFIHFRITSYNVCYTKLLRNPFPETVLPGSLTDHQKHSS